MIPFLRKVRETIQRHHMFQPQDRVLAGVSGGADSIALLLALHQLGYQTAVAHLNHGLRGKESDDDEKFVRDVAERLGVPFHAHFAPIQNAEGNLEAAGREARRAYFQDLVRTEGFTKVALAHNREDRVETFLLHLMRGAGTEGLVSMAPMSGIIVRPLLETPRQEIEGFLGSLGQAWRTDSSNSDMSFARNRMRHEIIPRLASLFNVQLGESLTRTVAILQDEDDWMNQMTKTWLDEHGGQILEVAALKEAHPALVRRLIRDALRRNDRALTDITFARVEAVRGLLDEGKSGRSIQLPGGAVVRRNFNQLLFSDGADDTPAEFDYELPIPGTVRVPELGRVFRASLVSQSAPEGAPSDGSNRVLVDGGRLGARVKIRNWKPGDYYNPAGWPAGKVKKLFQRARVPRSQRNRWPLFATDSAVIWVTSFPVSRDFTPSASAKKIVAFEALEG